MRVFLHRQTGLCRDHPAATLTSVTNQLHKGRLKMKTNLILQKVSFFHGIIDPNWVDGNPGQPGPVLRTSISDYIVAELLRDISTNLHNRDISTKLHSIGKELVSASAHNLAADWDGELDPNGRPFDPFFHPRPRGVEDLFAGPHPEPWLEHLTPSMNDIVLAHALRDLASLTSSEKASTAIKQAGEALVKTASSKLFDEYCGTPVKPHVPKPRPKITAA
jgi:hypothetical protein